MIFSHPRTHPLTQRRLASHDIHDEAVPEREREREKAIFKHTPTQCKDTEQRCVYAIGFATDTLNTAHYAPLRINVHNMVKWHWFVYLRVDLLDGRR
jgi:hypothetical protein